MVTRRRHRFITGVIAWMTMTAFVLVALDLLTYEFMFVVSFIGFLVLTDLFTPVNITPEWRDRLKWIVLLGVLVFGYLVARRFLAVFPWRVF